MDGWVCERTTPCCHHATLLWLLKPTGRMKEIWYQRTSVNCKVTYYVLRRRTVKTVAKYTRYCRRSTVGKYITVQHAIPRQAHELTVCLAQLYPTVASHLQNARQRERERKREKEVTEGSSCCCTHCPQTQSSCGGRSRPWSGRSCSKVPVEFVSFHLFNTARQVDSTYTSLTVQVSVEIGL